MSTHPKGSLHYAPSGGSAHYVEYWSYFEAMYDRDDGLPLNDGAAWGPDATFPGYYHGELVVRIKAGDARAEAAHKEALCKAADQGAFADYLANVKL